jgi:DNA-binding Xre family transcriptional regulator
MSENIEFTGEALPLHLAQLPAHLESILRKKTPKELTQIAAATDISVGSLRMFVTGQAKNPTLKTMIALCAEVMPGVELNLVERIEG